MVKSDIKLRLILIGFFLLIISGNIQAQFIEEKAESKPSSNAVETPTRIYISNDEHTDLMWTADAETYDKVFVDMLDYYLRLADETDGNPSPFRSRFNADGSFWLWTYEHKKSPEEFNLLIDHIKEGTINAPLTTLVSCYGAQPAEAVLRGMYYAGRLERKYNLRFTQAVAMENQGMPLGLSSLWAGSGAKYTWRGICGCASRMENGSWQQRDHEIYWACGHDNQNLLVKWHSLYSGELAKTGAKYSNQHSGGYAEAFDPISAIKFLDSDSTFLSRYRAQGMSQPYSVRSAFGFGWDALDRKTGVPYLKDTLGFPQTEHFHVIAKAQTTPERQVIVSNQEDFFQDFEQNYGKILPSESLTYGNEWDLYSASMSETSAKVKRAVEELRTAEALATLVSLKNPEFLKGRETDRDLAFTNLGLYWDHDWTADGPVSRDARAAWQERLAAEVINYTEKLHRDALESLGNLIAGKGKNLRFFVFNPLGWVRSDVADLAWEGPENIHVRDITSKSDVPHQFIVIGDKKYLRILATDLPSVGYKVFEVLQGKGKVFSEPAAIVSNDGTSIENSRIRLTVAADGSIRSLIDKASPDNDFAANIGGLTLNDFQSDNTEGEKIVVSNSGPVSATVTCQSKGTPTHRTSITLYINSNRIDICNEITENFNDVRHWSYSFNLGSPIVHTEEVGAVIKVKTKTEGGDYADRNARYDYATMNHFADITDGNNKRGVTLSTSDLSFVKLGESTPAHLDTKTPQLHVLAGGQVDKGLGIIAQNGAKYFLQRFALTTHKSYNATESMKFAMEHQNPTVTGVVKGSANANLYPANQFSLIKISNPDLLLWAFKPNEDGIEKGVVARVWNLAGNTSKTQFTGVLPFQSAHRLTHVETPIDSLPLSNGTLQTDIGAYRMETFGLMFENQSKNVPSRK